jgi:hypothetical protein
LIAGIGLTGRQCFGNFGDGFLFSPGGEAREEHLQVGGFGLVAFNLFGEDPDLIEVEFQDFL